MITNPSAGKARTLMGETLSQALNMTDGNPMIDQVLEAIAHKLNYKGARLEILRGRTHELFGIGDDNHTKSTLLRALNIDENMYSLYFKEIKKDVHLYVFEEMVLRLKFLEDSIAGKEEIIFPKLKQIVSLSTRAMNVLNTLNITTIEQIASYKESFYLNQPRVGKDLVKELENSIKSYGLSFASEIDVPISKEPEIKEKFVAVCSPNIINAPEPTNSSTNESIIDENTSTLDLEIKVMSNLDININKLPDKDTKERVITWLMSKNLK